MKALSLWQPFASAIIFGTKRIENRRWTPPDHVRISDLDPRREEVGR